MSYLPGVLVAHNVAQPNWVLTAAVGAVLGALVIPCAQLLSYPVRRLRPHPLSGRWYSYHLTFVSGRLELRFGTIRIGPGIRSRYTAIRENSAAPPGNDGKLPLPVLRYRGRVLPDEADQTVILFKGISHQETVVYRFLNRIPSNALVIPGVWMAYDHDLTPAAGAAILSRNVIDPGEVIRILQSWLVYEKGAMHLRKSPAPRRSDSPHSRPRNQK